MKVADYVAKYVSVKNETDMSVAASTIVSDLFKEIVQLSTERKISTNEGLFGIIDECDNKWKKICVAVEELNPEGFLALIHIRIPEVYWYYVEYKNTIIKRQQQKATLTRYSTQN